MDPLIEINSGDLVGESPKPREAFVYQDLKEDQVTPEIVQSVGIFKKGKEMLVAGYKRNADVLKMGAFLLITGVAGAAGTPYAPEFAASSGLAMIGANMGGTPFEKVRIAAAMAVGGLVIPEAINQVGEIAKSTQGTGIATEAARTVGDMATSKLPDYALGSADDLAVAVAIGRKFGGRVTRMVPKPKFGRQK